MDIAEVVVPNAPTLEQVAAALALARVDYLFVPEDVYSNPALPQLIAHFERVKLPALYLYPIHVRNGGLMSMSYDIGEGHTAAIDMVARILRGENPATIPVYVSTRYHVAVNRRTARAMGIEVPVSLLARADEVVD
jgi:putative ABC transport system substrate-binding protein